MLQRVRRPFSEEDRRLLEQYRQNAVGGTRFQDKGTVLAGMGGLGVGLVWFSTYGWLAVALVAGGGGLIGFLFDYRRYRHERARRDAAAAARWNPVIAVGVIEHVVADASSAVRFDTNEDETAWFLEVGERQVLCVWDWADGAKEHVEIDLVPGEAPTTVTIKWSGNELTPVGPPKKFGRGDRQPEQCEVLDGSLHELTRLLRDKGKAPSGRRKGMTSGVSKLGDELAALGFYKFVDADWRHDIDAEINREGAHSWYVAAGRAFMGDAESLAEGGVKDLLESMRSALDLEGVVLAVMEESYDEVRGYTLRIGSDEYTMWGEGEGRRSWELTTTRTLTLINHLLSVAGSDERIHLLDEGVFVLLTPAQLRSIENSGVFQRQNIPGAL